MSVAEKDAYLYLSDAEQAYWDIFTRLRELSDWPAFTEEQRDRKSRAKAWLQTRRSDIEANATKEGDWNKNHRRERYNFLFDSSLDRGHPRRMATLPTEGSSNGEKVLISEREMWWQVASVDDQTHKWRLANVDELTTIRKQIYTLAGQTTWNHMNRRQRWDNLCVATKTGEAFKNWRKTHDDGTGDLKPKPKPKPTKRQLVVKHARSHIGVTEDPPNSNKGRPHPSDWEERVIGKGMTGFAWCACFSTCMLWDAGIVGASSAGVIVCMDMAQRGVGIYKGWTTDPSKVRAGDLAVIGCKTCHIGVVVDDHDACHTIEGNTSPSTAGSQFNGGCVAEKHRPRNQIVGWCLVNA